MLSFKVIGCGAAGNKAVVELANSGYDKDRLVLLNSTNKDIPENADIKTIIFGNGLGGCGKERKLGKKMLLSSIKSNTIYDGMVDPTDQGIVLVGSTEGGSGSASIPILAKYFKDVHGANVTCVLFFGFQDDTRGLQNSIEICQELSEEYSVIAISNAKFLDECNGNKFKAERMANRYFCKIMKILTGQVINPGSQVIDDTDLYKIVTTPGYMMADSTTFKSFKNIEEFNSKLREFVTYHKFIDTPNNAGMKREALIFTTFEDDDNIDYSAKVIDDLYGTPYEKFTNVAHQDKAGSIFFAYIMSGMKLPVTELTDIYNKYIESSKKVDKTEDSFMDTVTSMRGNAEDDQFNVMGRKKNKQLSKESFFGSFGIGNDEEEY